MMNWAHAHLLLNHLPLLGTLFGTVLLLVAIARDSEEMKRVCLGVFVISALMAGAAYLTGSEAEDLVRDLPDISRDVVRHLIHQHENWALASLIGIGVLGAVSLLGLLPFRLPFLPPDKIVPTCLVLSVIVVGLMAWTSNLGGQIRHTETRPGFQPPPANRQVLSR